jgi:uncharacterized protein (DUF2249 family)/hemerythrin superfamily protein
MSHLKPSRLAPPSQRMGRSLFHWEKPMKPATHGTVDLRSCCAAERRAAVLAAFGTLAPGESFRLRSSEDPRRFLFALRAARPGEFEWSPLGCEVEIRRRQPANEALRQISEALASDHERLENLEARAFAALHRGDINEGGRLLASFVRGLKRHIRFEEERLFPAIEARTDTARGTGPIQVMREDHREILIALENLLRSVGCPDLAGDLHDELKPLLLAHHAQEENVFHPALEGLFSAAESDALVAQFQELPA